MSQQRGQIRVGRITGYGSNKVKPSYTGFTVIEVMTKSSPYGDLGPYVLKNDKGELMENIWQFSKVYPSVPYSKQKYSQYDPTIIWEHPAEVHIDNQTNQPNDKYWNWRKKGMECKYAVRYPVGYSHRHQVLYTLTDSGQKLNYIEARKTIYLPVYVDLVSKSQRFQSLKQRHQNGENLLIIEIDGPHQESLPYYKNKYNVDDSFIQGSTMLATQDNLNVMLNDDKHPFGHGYCLAIALQL
ncbi:hypothetical protein BH23THE1_BH23THE1_26340 [soil metagenome]